MLYSKGDTIELRDGKVALVLDNGLPGKKFVEQYLNQWIYYFPITGSGYNVNVGTNFKWQIRDNRLDPKQETVWYNILIGDQQGWVEERSLAIRRQHIKDDV